MAKQRKKPMGRDEVKDALIEAGIKLFAERGIKAVPIRDLADEANVNLALIYRHFGSKEDLVQATLKVLFERMGPVIDTEAASGEEILQSSFAAIKNYPEIFQVFAHVALEGDGSIFKDMKNPYQVDMVRQIKKGQLDGNLNSNVDARILLACSFALGLGWHIFQPMLIELAGLDKKSGKTIRKEIDEFWFGAIGKS